MNPFEDLAQLKRYLEAMETRLQTRLDELKPSEDEKDKMIAYAQARQIIQNNRAHYLSLLQFDPDTEKEVVKPVRYTGPKSQHDYFVHVYESMVKLLGVLHYTHEDIHRVVVRCSAFLDCCAQCNQSCIKRAVLCDCRTVQYCTERCRRLDEPSHKLACPKEIAKKDEELKRYREKKARETDRVEREKKEVEELQRTRKRRETEQATKRRVQDMAKRRVDLGLDKTLEEAMAKLRIEEPALFAGMDESREMDPATTSTSTTTDEWVSVPHPTHAA